MMKLKKGPLKIPTPPHQTTPSNLASSSPKVENKRIKKLKNN